MACNPAHPFRHYTTDDGPACFDCWQVARNARRAAVRAELARVLAAGLTVCETRRDDTFTDWQYWPETGEARTQHDGRVGFTPALIHQTPDSLAAHLESRAEGFGFTIAVYCYRCGESLISLQTTGGEDYHCAACDLGDLEHAAELRAEGK